jgi:hypothetical protein
MQVDGGLFKVAVSQQHLDRAADRHRLQADGLRSNAAYLVLNISINVERHVY